MSDIISLVAFGTFGNPNGFRQTFFLGDRTLSKQVKTFDLNTNAIKLFPKSNVYMIRKEETNAQNLISYSIYSYAKELNSERSGTFVGSSLLFKNKIAIEKDIVNLLNEFQTTLLKNNVKNDTIQVNHSDNLTVNKPADFEKIKTQLNNIEDLNFSKFSNKTLVVYCSTNVPELSKYLSQSIDLLNVYDCIYFTQSREVAEFVGKKGIFKLIQNVGNKNEFEQEIQNLQAERQKVIDSSISNFSKEINLLENDKSRLINEFLTQLERNQQIHQENEQKIKESKEELEKIKLIYSDFSNKIKDFTNQLKSGRKLEDVKNLYSENKRIFIASVNQVKRPNFINRIPKHKAKTNLTTNHEKRSENSLNSDLGKKKQKGKRLNKYKISTFLLSLVLIGFTSYHFFFGGKDKNIENNPVIIESNNTEAITAEDDLVIDLNPEPNNELNENDYGLTMEKIKNEMSLDEVVWNIFDQNPKDIKGHYEGQEKEYGQMLLQKNKECFEKKDSLFYFRGDTLFHIPSYKK